MFDNKRQPRRRYLPATIRVVALFVKIALVDATLTTKRLYPRFAHRKQGIERLEKSIRNGLHRSIHFASSYDFILILVNIVQRFKQVFLSPFLHVTGFEILI